MVSPFDFTSFSLSVSPLEEVTLSLAEVRKTPPGHPGALRIKVTDASGHVYVDEITELDTMKFRAAGCPGEHKVGVFSGDELVAELTFYLDPRTRIEAERYGNLYNQLARIIQQDEMRFTRDGKTIRTNPHWLRDHIHEMKGYRYWQQDLSSFVDTVIEMQHPDGFFYEIVGPTEGADRGLVGQIWGHYQMVSDKHRMLDPENSLAFIRLELEADIEYLVVEAVDTIWRATGDTGWMAARLPALDKALRYCMTDPTRWSDEYGLMKRTFTIDTWDFTYGVDTSNRRIEPGMPMGIMHGDNSGLYDAMQKLARMYEAVGDRERARYWEREARALRERANRLLFNGRFYMHQFLLQPVDTGVSETDILSLSNTYDINRGLPTHEMAVKIIDEYRRRKETHKATHFAEWFSIDPPYPVFGPYGPGQYINGGIASFVAGELAKASFNHGREEYGADILSRVADLVERDGTLYFLYTPDGKNQGGGPSGWGAAAVISAMIQGLFGVDDSELNLPGRKASLSPRLVSAGIDSARIVVSLGPRQDSYVAYEFTHDRDKKQICILYAGTAEKVNWSILLPNGARDVSVKCSGKPVETKTMGIENSSYITFETPGPGAFDSVVGEVVVNYSAGV